MLDYNSALQAYAFLCWLRYDEYDWSDAKTPRGWVNRANNLILEDIGLSRALGDDRQA